MSKTKYLVHSYIKVIGVPDPWEGSGEDDCDRESLVGHIGIVIEVDIYPDFVPDTSRSIRTYYLIRFPYTRQEHQTCQRWIEEDKLELVATSPVNPITQFMFEQ
jgi:hypothetical protein